MAGLELLDDMPNDAESMELVRGSLKSAVAKLQFARMAYGASGSKTATVDLNDAKGVAEGYMAHEKPALIWQGEGGYAAKNFAKAVLNLVVLASHSISRGGEVTVSIEEIDPGKATVTAKGERIRLQPRAARRRRRRRGDGCANHPALLHAVSRPRSGTQRHLRKGRGIDRLQDRMMWVAAV